MSLEALLANLKPYNAKLHELRGFPGAVRSAAAIRACIEGSDLATGKIKTKVQDAYSMRSSPQVIGAAHDALAWAATQVEIELNGVGDNPIFVPEDNLTLTGANFQGTPVSLPMEMVGQAITMVCVLSERRLNRLENPALSQGLPDFLTPNPGFYSGLMLSQYTADMLITEQRILSAPASDHVHPGRRRPGRLRLHGHEHGPQEPPDPRTTPTPCSASSSWRPRRPWTSASSAPARACKRPRQSCASTCEHLDVDRPLYPDHNAMRDLVAGCDILDAVEAAVGPLC